MVDTTTIAVIVTAVLASSGGCMSLSKLAYARLPARRIREEREGRRLGGPAFLARLVVNSVVSTALIYAFTLLLSKHLFSDAPVPLWRGALQALGILVLYDFLYYLLHRYPFHRWSVLQRVHAVHHRVRDPIAIDSLYIHPVENVLGLSLLMLCTWLVGPVHVYAFGACFFVYSWLNIIVHGGVDLPIPYLGMLARKHTIHHGSMRAGNYASLSPLPDLLFGTADRGGPAGKR